MIGIGTGATLVSKWATPENVLGLWASLGLPSDTAFGTHLVSTTRLLATCLPRPCAQSFPLRSPQWVSSVWATWWYPVPSQTKRTNSSGQAQSIFSCRMLRNERCLFARPPSMLGAESLKKCRSGFSDDYSFPTLKGAAQTITQGPGYQNAREY